MIENKYMERFTEATNRCFHNAKLWFVERKFSCFYIYAPYLDGRIFESLEDNMIVLPSEAMVEQQA